MEQKNATMSGELAVEAAQQDQQVAQPGRINFRNPRERAAHVQAFLAWLPEKLHPAPGIEWENFPSKVMGYLIRNVTDNREAMAIPLALGCAMPAVKQKSLESYCQRLTLLLRQLRTHFGVQDLEQLRSRQLWERFLSERTPTRGELQMLVIYQACTSLHLPAYLEGLSVRDRAVWQVYALPPLPAGFLEKQGLSKAVIAATQQRRKDQSDVLVPLFPLLVELVQLRKQSAERLYQAFCQQRARAIAGEVRLPHRFQYTDRLLSVAEDASTIAAATLTEREVTLSFTLWDRPSWVKEHPEHYGSSTQKLAERGLDAYAPERALYFLHYEGPPTDLLWFGGLLANRQLRHLPHKADRDDETGQGESAYFFTSRPGLLTPAIKESQWLTRALSTVKDVLIFEPESLYRGTLYAAALATLALTNGSRLNELLQVSASRFETIVVDELKQLRPTGRKIGLLVQHLLPKGSRQESERQFYLIGEMAGRLLTEIGQLLEATHDGTIPVVHPYESSKAEDLHPEPFFFQWAASDEGRLGLLTTRDVGKLLQFLFYGLTLTTRTGKPIRVAPHLLRHVMATHARTVKNVPAEAVAYLLHHRVTLSDSRHALSLPEATAYYSRLPVEQLLALLFEAQSALPSHQGQTYLQAPSPQTLEQMDEALREIFAQWGTIGPTVLGYCSAGLCVRPNNRALCLGCHYLVPHYSNLGHARTWRRLYVLQAELHDAHGHAIDAQQARHMIQCLDDTITIMQIQIRARQDGGYLPFADTLPPPHESEGEQA